MFEKMIVACSRMFMVMRFSNFVFRSFRVLLTIGVGYTVTEFES